MLNKRYYPQHMHIHSIYEPGASMEGHIHFASLQGMKHIWFTEHDIYWAKKPFYFGFEPEECQPDENGAPTKAFLPTAYSVGKVFLSDEAYEGGYSLCLAAEESSGDTWRGAAVMNDGKRSCQSLCRIPTVKFACRGVKSSDGDTRYIIDLALSERPPECTFAHILFVMGSTEGLEAPHTLIIPITIGEDWQIFSADVSEIASSRLGIEAGLGGFDNVLSFITFRVETRLGASASFYVDSLSVESVATAEETKALQTAVATEIGEKYGVTPFVTAEITAGGHKNCFSTDTPVFNYGDPNHKWTQEEASALMVERGLVFAINHPFVHLKGLEGTVDYDAECDAEIEKYSSALAYGATLLEVGFPFGRYAPYTTHTRLWDGLALRGVILTGHGATDAHTMSEGWWSGNNFASFIAGPSDTEPTEADFIASMRSGDLYAANPIQIKSRVSFTADGERQMGSINILPVGTRVKASLSLDISNHNWKVAWVVNGERVRYDNTTRVGYSGSYEHSTVGDIDFIRAEVYDYFGNLLLMTNPIYFTPDIKNIKSDTSGRAIICG